MVLFNSVRIFCFLAWFDVCGVCVCVSSCCTWSREWVWPRVVVVVVVILPMAECSLFHFVLACLLLLPYVNFTSSNCTLADSIPAICIRSVFKTETHSGISTFVRHRQFHLQWRRNDKIGINCKRVIHMWMGLISFMVFRYISKSIPNSEYSVYTCLMVWRLVFREEWDGVWIIMLRRTFVFAAVVGDYRLMYIFAESSYHRMWRRQQQIESISMSTIHPFVYLYHFRFSVRPTRRIVNIQ